MAQSKDKPLKIALNEREALKAFLQTPPERKKKPPKKKPSHTFLLYSQIQTASIAISATMPREGRAEYGATTCMWSITGKSSERWHSRLPIPEAAESYWSVHNAPQSVSGRELPVPATNRKGRLRGLFLALYSGSRAYLDLSRWNYTMYDARAPI
jgi:hypothetical protein